MVKIKFCGMRRPEDAAHAALLGARYVGAIMTRSPRQVDVSQAREVFAAAPGLKRVGVFAQEKVAGILRRAEEIEVDVLQLHGRFASDDFDQMRQEFDGEIWTVVGVDPAKPVLPEGWKKLADLADAFLLDTRVRGKTGGTGRPFDWKQFAPQSREVSREIPIVLAGGLTAENVVEAVRNIRPAVVDVSSGVELSPGVKSPELMSAFARAVASASIV